MSFRSQATANRELFAAVEERRQRAFSEQSRRLPALDRELVKARARIACLESALDEANQQLAATTDELVQLRRWSAWWSSDTEVAS